MAYAKTTTDKPKANAIPSRPNPDSPASVSVPATAAAPQPKSTSPKVPTNSATNFVDVFISMILKIGLPKTRVFYHKPKLFILRIKKAPFHNEAFPFNQT